MTKIQAYRTVCFTLRRGELDSSVGKRLVKGLTDSLFHFSSLALGSRAVFSVQFSPDGRYLASGAGDDSLRIFTQEDAEMAGEPASRSYTQLVANEKAHSADVNCVQWNPTQVEGKWVLATAGDDRLIKIWEFEANDSR
eukprot:1181213-Prorocentrum_minimum.AAC.3